MSVFIFDQMNLCLNSIHCTISTSHMTVVCVVVCDSVWCSVAYFDLLTKDWKIHPIRNDVMKVRISWADHTTPHMCVSQRAHQSDENKVSTHTHVCVVYIFGDIPDEYSKPWLWIVSVYNDFPLLVLHNITSDLITSHTHFMSLGNLSLNPLHVTKGWNTDFV